MSDLQPSPPVDGDDSAEPVDDIDDQPQHDGSPELTNAWEDDADAGGEGSGGSASSSLWDAPDTDPPDGLQGSPEIDDLPDGHDGGDGDNSGGTDGGGTDGGGPGGGGSGARRALCIGIDKYPKQPLYGCVNDARRWHGWFESNGFSMEPIMIDEAATREAILEAIRRLVTASQPGDVVAIQYSGHGTQLPDIDGDEQSSTTPTLDEALVPVDHRQNGYVIDDDIGEICDLIPEGANVTFFMDCCHSGTISRGVFGGRAPAAPSDARPRFIHADTEMIEVHERTRQAAPTSRAISERPADGHREVSISACLSSQVAWEHDGQGDFTRNAMEVLQRQAPASLSNDDFVTAVKQVFGASPRQNPLLSCADRFRSATLLGTR